MSFSEERMCIICGKKFTAKHNRRLICYEDHYRTCEVCGKEFVCNVNPKINAKKVCSEKCRRKLIGKNSTLREKQYRRICKVCGKEYYSVIKDENRDCGLCDNVHTKYCVVCGKPFQVKNKYLYYKNQTCSNECKILLKNKTWHEHEEINLQKMKDVLQEKYGVDYTWQIPEVKEKSKQTSIERYGEEYYTQTDEFKDRMIQKNQEKYGVDWYMQTDEYWEKTKSTWMDKYGVDNPSKSSEVISGFVVDPSKIDNLMKLRENPQQFISDTFETKPTLQQVADSCGVRSSSVGWILTQLNCHDLVSYVYSYMELEIFEFLSSFLPDEEILRNTFQVITPYELDLYLPKYKFGIECNPTSTHNSTSNMWSDTDHPQDKNYHKMKTDLCNNKNIFLFHVFGYEWNHKKDIIKSMIQNALGFTKNKIYARNTEVRLVSFADSMKFLELNHRQGKAWSSIRLGLYYNDEIVSLMTFGKMRNTIGTGKEDLGDCYELVRFCNKLNTSVVGGASKLFQHFLKEYNPERVRSFSDKSHTKGSLYSILGFKQIHESDPGYVWVNTKTDIAYSRVNAQKQNIKKFLNDDTIDLSKTETQIMSEHGYVQVFDSGVITWEYRRCLDV